MATKNKKKSENGNARTLEATLWAAADKLRGHMDAAEYKHVVLGLIFLKYISDAFEEHQNKLKKEIPNSESELYLDKRAECEAALEDRDEYIAAIIFRSRKKRVGRICSLMPSNPRGRLDCKRPDEVREIRNDDYSLSRKVLRIRTHQALSIRQS